MSKSKIPIPTQYGGREFDESQLTGDPISLFSRWFSEAVEHGVPEANGACLCTVGEGGGDGRIVLLKGFDEQGFQFFTNHESTKGRQLAEVSGACMVFWWQSLRRQIRIQGAVERLSEDESEEYFQTRPRDSQLGAWASRQSRPIADRGELETLLSESATRFPEGTTVPKPAHWGGHRLVPSRVEFWQGRDNRLHDRIVYTAQEGRWTTQRLMP